MNQGLSAITEALHVVEQSDETYYQAELYRLRGELLLQQVNSGQISNLDTDAEASFRKAIEIASRQQAKSLELPATMSLARLLRDTGRRDEARAMLAEIYNWFTEGFDTADLKEANALLDELSH